jgi:hypothetical protein
MSSSQDDSVPASGAAVVPAVGVAVHAVFLWLAPDRPSVLEPWLPLPLELLFLWFPFGSLCVWFARFSPQRARRSPAERGVDVAVAVVAALTALAYLVEVRLEAHTLEWSNERLLTELFAHLSTTVHGVPLIALASLLGWGAVSTVTARALTGLARQYDSLAARASLWGAASGLLLFAVGSSAVLRYATGSPWPLFG